MIDLVSQIHLCISRPTEKCIYNLHKTLHGIAFIKSYRMVSCMGVSVIQRTNFDTRRRRIHTRCQNCTSITPITPQPDLDSIPPPVTPKRTIPGGRLLLEGLCVIHAADFSVLQSSRVINQSQTTGRPIIHPHMDRGIHQSPYYLYGPKTISL